MLLNTLEKSALSHSHSESARIHPPTSIDAPSKANPEDPEVFAHNRSVLVESIDTTATLLTSLNNFNADHWCLRYPHQLGLNTKSPTIKRSSSLFSGPSSESAQSSCIVESQRSNSHDVTSGTSLSPKSYAHPLSVLCLDLKTSLPTTTSTGTLPALLSSLSASTLSQLLSRKITSSLSHLSVLKNRVLDNTSRVLVTGDLNAGKSTLVNTLLRRELMPTDQQPCTEVFCEILDAKLYNNGVEEVHAVRNGEVDRYDSSEASTFERFSLEQLDKLVQIEETVDADDFDEYEDKPKSPYQILKVYLNEDDGLLIDQSHMSFINNGLVNISLIDAPGLNRDTLSTTAVFARQSEIDVIAFVVSAENHFTLSAKEFLLNASREKAYVFIIVNKWGGIKDKARCKRLVGEQIKQLSPKTWENRHELVHFVESEEALRRAIQAVGEEEVNERAAEFQHLETSLKSFVLLKRSQSKLAPARHYLLNLLSDLAVLADVNVDAAEKEMDLANQELGRMLPENIRLHQARDEVEEDIARVEEEIVQSVKSLALKRLKDAVNVIGNGELIKLGEPGSKDMAIKKMIVEHGFNIPTELPPYPGVLGIWQWAAEVRDTLLMSLEGEVRLVEEITRTETTSGVKEIMNDLGNKYLPESEKGKSDRVFRPEVMFNKRRKGMEKKFNMTTCSVGLNAFESSDIAISVLDLFDLERLISTVKGHKLAEEVEETDAGTLSVVSLGVGAFTMFGSRAVGIRGFVEGFSRISELLGSRQARKWAGPVFGILTLGLAVYVVLDLPNAIPRNIGKRLRATYVPASLSHHLTASSPEPSFMEVHSDRVAKETRKVLRMAGWDLREKFRSALERSDEDKKELEGSKHKAENALTWLDEFLDHIATEEKRVADVDLTSKIL